MSTGKLTPTQLRIMRNIRDHDGNPTALGFIGLAEHGGAGGSRLSLERRGLVRSVPMSLRYELTDDGRTVLAEAEAAAEQNKKTRGLR